MHIIAQLCPIYRIPAPSANVEGVERFSVKEVIETGRIGDVKFWFNDNFGHVFGSMVETNISAATLRSHRLKKDSVDRHILEELGGAEQARVFLAHMFALACCQGQGQEGFLLTNGYANVFYVRANGTFWAVSGHWYSSCGYWHVSAYPITGPGGWGAGDRVISR